ncbi:MAG: M14 family zinc carboxypeptidase [Anaerolineae bacterium]
MKRVLSLLLLAALLISSMPSAARAQADRVGGNSQERVFVVRITYTDRADLAPLTERLDIWDVQPERHVVIAALNLGEWQRLVQAGYRVELDAALTLSLYTPRVPVPGQTNGIIGYPCYRTVEETYTTATNMVAQHPTLAQWIDIGDSWEKINSGGLAGYDLRVLKLTNQGRPGPKPIFFAMSSVHAREYAPAELNTRFAEYLINNYGVDADVTWLLDYTEIHLLLQANPDGRKKAETGLSWRKNTDNNYCANTNSRGVDLNRNWPFKWNSCAAGLGCSSGVQCDETYRGPSAASEPETQATVAYARSIFPDWRPDDLTTAAPITATGLFLDLHSYSQLMLWPWGFTYSTAPNGPAMQTLGRKLAFFNNYTPEQSIGLYPTDGTTDDTTYGERGVAAFTIEMGSNFFESCTSFENTVVPQNLPALIYAAKAAQRPYQLPTGPDVISLTATPSTTAQLTVTVAATANDTRYNNSNGTEPTQAIAAARYSIDAPSWVAGTPTYPLTAADGAFNTAVEGITTVINGAGLSLGRHTVFVEAQDAAGNWGLPTAVFITVTSGSGIGGWPQLTPLQQVGQGEPGAAVAYTLTLQNLGPFTDTFTLTLASSVWPTELGQTSIFLPPTQVATMAVTVTVPLDAVDGNKDFATITATGLQGTTSAVIRTNALSVFKVYLPALLQGE